MQMMEGNKMERKKKTKRASSISYSFSNPDKALRKETIGPRTKFLWYVQKNGDVFTGHWIWSTSAKKLTQFLLEAVIKRAVLNEYCAPSVYRKSNDMSFDEVIAIAFATSLSTGSVDLTVFSELTTGESDLRHAVAKKANLNLASTNLMNATSRFYYSLSWQFFSSAKDAIQNAKGHPSFHEGNGLKTAFTNDSSL